MELVQLLPASRISLRIAAEDRACAIRTMIALLEASGVLYDAAAFERDVFAREEQTPTDVGSGVAIPHAKSAAVRHPALAAVTLQKPLPSTMGEPVRMLFLIAVPADAAAEHLRIMAELAACLRRPQLDAQLLEAANASAFLDLLQNAAPGAAADPDAPATYRVLAVTACPTGIAHTFIAKEALLEKAHEMGISMKVEADGAAGVEEPLTDAEIAAAECIIIAADRTIPTARFAGKPLFRVPVTEAVRHPEQLLHRALSATAPDFVPPTPGLFSKGTPLLERLRAVGHSLYTHLMSGLSRMLPFVTGGGMLIALSYLLAQVGGDEFLVFGNQLPGMLNTVGQACFTMMYVVLAGFVASSLGDTHAFVPGAIGGYLAWAGVTNGAVETWVSSGFWGALVAGFAAGVFMSGLTQLGHRLPHSLDQIKVTLLYPALSLLFIALLMIYFVNPPLGRFNEIIYAGLNSLHGGSRMVLCAVLGGLMALDYGGPINKAAYLFGTVALVNAQYDIMAAVMIGGMTPPIGIAIACLLFPAAFTDYGKRSAPSNFLLGASFVTEGALPFALRDPLRVIPSCFVGSTVAGAMCQWMGCGVPAPHGGLFLLPVMDNPVGFLAALGIGSLITALMLGLLKPQLSKSAATIQTAVIVHRDVRWNS